jgi:hypothetical protein
MTRFIGRASEMGSSLKIHRLSWQLARLFDQFFLFGFHTPFKLHDILFRRQIFRLNTTSAQHITHESLAFNLHGFVENSTYVSYLLTYVLKTIGPLV